MAGNFFGGTFFGGGFFGKLPSAGGTIGGGRQRKHRVILPDGRIVWANKAELRLILNRLTAEYQDEERKIVPVVRKQKKKESDAAFLAEASPATAADFPAIKPQIRVTKYIEVPGIDLDIEAMLRAYIEGAGWRKNRQEEEEWLMLLH